MSLKGAGLGAKEYSPKESEQQRVWKATESLESNEKVKESALK